MGSLKSVHERVNAPVAASGARVVAGNGARILTLDIECSPTIAHVWGLWDQNVGLNQIVEDGRMICFAAKWYGDSQTMFWSVEKDGHEAMVEAAWRLLDECDVLVSFNGIKYDVKHLNREFVLAGLGRPRPYRNVDLLPVVRREFKFPSNKLDYVASRLGLGHKVAHEGHGLWVACMEGDRDAWMRMETYNRGDVELTEALFDRLRPWLSSAVHLGVWAGGEGLSCPSCGGVEREVCGEAVTAVSVFECFRCLSCGGVFRGARAVRRVASRRVA